jgi:hypothetical protein
MKSFRILIALCLIGSPVWALDLTDLVGEQWYGLYMTGKKVGYSHNVVEVDKDGRAIVTEDARFKLNMAGLNQDMTIYSKRTYSADRSLKSIESKVDDIAGTNRFNAVVDGETLILDLEVGGQKSRKTLPKPKESLNDVIKNLELLANNPKPGDQVSFSMFEPMYQTELTGTSEILGTEERMFDGVSTMVYKIKTKMSLMGIESIAFVTADGRTLEDKVGGGIITMRLEPKEIATDVNYSNDTIISNAAMVDGLISRPRTRDEVKLRIKGPLDTDLILNDDRQTFEKRVDSYTFTGKLEKFSAEDSATIPVSDDSVMQWIKPSTFVQSDHPKMIATAKEIVGDETNAKVISDKLARWVSENMHSTFSARLTNSLEVLENREGDCTEHSMLYIGLARAAGLPAREVAGLIYVDRPRPGFYFHQWAKVWVGKWIEVDPTFDQEIADATHIKLAEGDLFEQTRILPVIGQLSIELLP